MKWLAMIVLVIVIALTILASLPFTLGQADEVTPPAGVTLAPRCRDVPSPSLLNEGGLDRLRRIFANDATTAACIP